MSLAGRVALVTGASRGIGREVALALAKAGSHVAVNYLSHHEEAQAVVDLAAASGVRAIAIGGDVSDVAVVEQMFDQTAESLGPIDIAVTNAYFSQRQPFYEADLEGFRRTVDVSMWGAFYTLRAAARRMIARGNGGAIVVISSPHAVLAVPRSMAYNMSKAAIDHMARTAAIELAEHRIRVNILHPGWIDTPGERKYATEAQIRAGGQQLPWGRLGSPQEIGRGVVFLCDPESDYITGSTLSIDGGISLPWWASRGTAAPG